MQSRLAAFKIFRRLATVAVFRGRHLEFIDIHHLSNVPKIAGDTLDRFIGWTVENFHPDTGALAMDEDEDHPRAQLLTDAAERKLLASGVPIWKVNDAQLLVSYGVPALTQKQQLRRTAQRLWPYVPAQHSVALDAALVGLYVQVERLLSHH
jgi:hypothetical protein